MTWSSAPGRGQRCSAVLSAALIVGYVSGCTAPDSAPVPPPAIAIADQPYSRGEFTVRNPRLIGGVTICDVLTTAEKKALVGPARVEGGGSSCGLTGNRGHVGIYVPPYSVDVDSETASSDMPGHRETIGGNDAWISPSTRGCSITVAVSRTALLGALSMGGNGQYTCNDLRTAAQLILDRLPAQT